VVEGDVVDVVVTSASFNNASIGNGKPVTANLTLSGADAGNYTVNATAHSTANITAITLQAQFTNPVNNATNVDMSQPVTWTAVPGVDAYYLYIGTSAGAKNVVNTGETQATSYLVVNAPSDVTLYARLWTRVDGVWRFVDITFTAASGASLSFTYPATGATTAHTTQALQWTSVANAQAYYLYIGTAAGLKNLVNSGEIQVTSYLASGLPINQQVYARLWVKVGGIWSYIDRTFTATVPIAQFTTPTSGATNVDLAQAFQWTAVASGEGYYLYVGSSQGASDLLNSGELASTSYQTYDLPTGQLLYARLWTKYGGIWRYTDITFTAGSAAPLTTITPVNGATNVDPTGFITWTAVSNAQLYYLYVGTTPGAKDLIDSQELCDGAGCNGGPTATSWPMLSGGRAPAPGLGGRNGETVYVRLWTKIAGVWRFVDSSFTLAP
jgi:hypothetical protein